MKYLLTITLYLFFSTSYANNELVDPDSINPSMPVVSYLISESNLEIMAYRLGSPSKLKVKLCQQCSEKIYILDPDAELRLLKQPLATTKLTEALLKKDHPKLRLAINRSKGMIIYLHLGVNEYDEFVPNLTPKVSKNNPTGVIN